MSVSSNPYLFSFKSTTIVDLLVWRSYRNTSLHCPQTLSRVNNNNSNNNSELYLHDYNNTALQKRRKHHNYSNLTLRVQFQLWYIYIYIITFIQYSNKGQINLFLILLWIFLLISMIMGYLPSSAPLAIFDALLCTSKYRLQNCK